VRNGFAWTVPALLALLMLLSPLGGGGTSSLLVFVLHSLAFLAVAVACQTTTAPGVAPRALWLAMAFAAWCVLGMFRASYGFAAFTVTADVLVALGVFWASWRVGGTPGSRRLWTLALLATMVLQVFLAVARATQNGWLRAAGTFLNANRTAAFINLGLGLVLAHLLARRRGRRGWMLLAIVLVGAQFWPIASRGGLVALVLVFGTFLAARARTTRARWAVAGLALGLVAVAGAAMVHRFAGEDIYRYDRVRIWSASVQAAQEHPVSGVGPGMFEHLARNYAFPRSESPVRFNRRFHTTHSQYLELLVETGAVGLLLLLALGVALALDLRKGRQDGEPGQRTYRTGVFLGLATLAVHGVVEPVLASPAVVLSAAILAGSALATRRCEVRGGALPARLFVPSLAVAMGLYYVAVLAPWQADQHWGRFLAARDATSFREELRWALWFNPFHAGYYRETCERVLRLSPRLEPGSYAACYNYSEKAVRLFDLDPAFHLTRARVSKRGAREIFEDQAGIEEALEHYRAAVALARADPIPAAGLAFFLMNLGRDEEVLQAVGRALEIEPHFLDARRLEIGALERLGRHEMALAAREELQASLDAIGDYRPEDGYESAILNWRPEEVFQRARGN